MKPTIDGDKSMNHWPRVSRYWRESAPLDEVFLRLPSAHLLFRIECIKILIEFRYKSLRRLSAPFRLTLCCLRLSMIKHYTYSSHESLFKSEIYDIFFIIWILEKYAKYSVWAKKRRFIDWNDRLMNWYPQIAVIRRRSLRSDNFNFSLVYYIRWDYVIFVMNIFFSWIKIISFYRYVWRLIITDLYIRLKLHAKWVNSTIISAIIWFNKIYTNWFLQLR